MGTASGFFFFLQDSLELSGVPIFCFDLNFWSKEDIEFLYFRNLSEQSGVWSRETRRMKADSD